MQIMGSPTGLTVNPAPTTSTPRYRLSVSLNINNLFNQANYTGFSGVMTSKLFPAADQRIGRAPDPGPVLR